MSNNLLNISYITNEGLDVLDNNLIFLDKFDRQYSKEFGQKNNKIGATVNIRRPPRFVGTFGPALNVEDTNETYVALTLLNQFHVDVQFTTADLLLSMDMFKPRVLNPMMKAVANRPDSDAAFFAYQNTALSVGTPGVSPSNYKLFSDANAILDLEATPPGERSCILDPLSASAAIDGIKGLFNPQGQVSTAVKKGFISSDSPFAGVSWFRDQNVVSFTTGAQGGTPVLTANTGGAFLTTGWAQNGFIQTNGWTNSTAVVKVGDVIQIAGVYPANPQSRVQYGNSLKQFTVLPPFGYLPSPTGVASTPGLQFAPGSLTSGTFNAATGVYTSGASTGPLSIMIGECCITAGQFVNAATTSAFTSTAALTVNGGTGNAAKVSPQGIIMHKDAFAAGFADLPVPRMNEYAARASDPDSGLSIRFVSAYTINNDAEPTRADILYGFGSMYRQAAIRVAG